MFPQLYQFYNNLRNELANKIFYKIGICVMHLKLTKLQAENQLAQKIKSERLKSQLKKN